ncbi:N-acetyltransferase family protein [Streptomyces sp. NPDC004082]|uniref:GNAT family N-acetyltransferase n=1 Tax=unclassified Streptomyces TaxID=2593676 RepID=UPI0033B4A258
MTTDFRVRRAEAADAPELARLRWAFKQEDYEADHEVDAPAPVHSAREAEQWIRERLGDGRWLAWVAESDGVARGHVFLNLVERVPEAYEDNTPLGYVTNFYVTPGFRDRGCGAALLDALRRHARATGMDVLVVWPSERSAPLYRRAGFRPPEELLEARDS